MMIFFLNLDVYRNSFGDDFAFSTACSTVIPVKFCAPRFLPLILSSINAPTQMPGITLSGSFGAFGPPKSVLHHPGSVKFMQTSVPSSLLARSFVTLSKAALLAEYPACSGSFRIPLVVFLMRPQPL